MTHLRQKGLALFGLAILLLAACGRPQRLYSLDPVDPDGRALRFDSAVAIHFEDGGRRDLAVGELVQVEEDRLTIEGGDSWPLETVASIDWRDDAGALQSALLLTPDDLLDFDDLPRLERLTTKDGHVVEIEGTRFISRWSEDLLAIEVSEDGEHFEAIPLETIHSVELHPTDLADATFKSWKFYVVVAATAVLAYVFWNPDSENLAVQ